MRFARSASTSGDSSTAFPRSREAAADPSLHPLIAGSMLEARRALLAAHPALGSDLHDRVAAALTRFGDRELADPIERVAREPIRKLGPGDRLLGPAELIRRRTG